MLSDDKLIDQIKYGNERAAEELITRYYASILRYCRWHCSSVEKAEDLTQEIFYKLFKNISGYQGKRKFKAYLYTIANRVCIDESRKIHFCPLEDEESIVDECNEILRLEDKEEVNYLLSTLSPEQREAIILRFGEQLEFHEIAKVIWTCAVVMLGSCVCWAISSRVIPWLYATSAIGFWLIAFVVFGIFFMKEVLFIVEMRKEGKMYGIIA